ncbi:MAG: HK97 gp10 family phage protein [Desulfurellales bacterium]|nr:MAG: HK97 gp10 family phage protein [Desulfurellales bacterium]
MITGYIHGKDQLIARLEGMPGQLRKWLLEAVTDATIRLQRGVVADKLTGQVLSVRTGTLRRSINMRVEQTPTSITGIVGTNVHYGAIHEFGGTVQQHQRLVTMVFGKPLKFPVWATVKEYNLPERSFLRSTLHDQLPSIRQSIQNAVAKGARQALKP